MVYSTALLLSLALAAPALGSPITPISKRWTCSSSNKTDCSLASLAEQSGKLYFGNAWQSFYLDYPGYQGILDSEFSQYTPENEMKWEVIEPTRGNFNWTGADIIIAEAKKTSSYVRGHNFVWHQQTPDYVLNTTDPNTLKEILTEHVNAVMGRYGNDLYAFDVINEPLNDNGTLREDTWYNVLGPDYLGIALDIAHAAAPNVKLYINDYNIESTNNKSLALVEIAKQLLADGHPLHGIGFESHFVGGQLPTDIAETMKMFTDLGLDVAITELDIRVPVDNMGIANSTWLDIQAQEYASVVEVCLGNDKCPGVTVWGFDDYHSWIPGVFAGEGAACLYNFDLSPKPAFYSVQNAL